ncbi:alpha/beta hydrolase family protein [Rudaea cellulosilytica]|uniref:alpha/beta hydrolase family protein n=1 Tax=Rudaea cellulosilytica TaxID=540746 RepID=UPI0003753283|nr:S9 family peptidase [Rudaea cellulosilytica]
MALLLMVFTVPAQAQVPALRDLAKHEQFRDVKISPDGQYLAVTGVVKDKTILSLLRLADMSGVNLRPIERDEVQDFWWLGSHRIVYNMSAKLYDVDGMVANGELLAVNADGGNKTVLYSWRRSAGMQGFAVVEGRLGGNEKLLVNVRPWGKCDHGPYPTARSLAVDGSMETLATAPICNASFVADNDGTVRFAHATGDDLKAKVYYRASASAEWELLFDEGVTHRIDTPLRFTRDNKKVYFSCPGEHKKGGVCLWNVADRRMEVLWSGNEADADELLDTFDGRDAYAIASMPGRPALILVDKSARESEMMRNLAQAFTGQHVSIGSHTDDGSHAVVFVDSDTNPGEYYLYDVAAHKLRFLVAKYPWLKRETLSPMEPVEFAARDGTSLHGYLTRPQRTAPGRLPLVVYVHGGPYGIRDRWSYDPYGQALASRGYAVLQVNFRGSGGYGEEFQNAGAREWGGKMQDDVADATRWAIAQGIADPQRVCIFGASYGGYAALEGVAKEPDLYRCAIGYVGVYDLPMMFKRGDIPESRFGKNYLKWALGENEEELRVRSPVAQADKIKAKVMLVVGGNDGRVPEEHGKAMRDALKAKGAEPEWLYDRTEGHGFYAEEHVTELFERLLGFLDREIGPNHR